MVSVIIPVYNVEKYLKKCVDSVIAQTYSDLQIILVDDESPDNCGKICEEYKKQDDRIEVIHRKNGGLGMARNSGLEKVRGDYLLFLDSDDWIDENLIEVLVGAIESNCADVVLFSYKRCGNDGQVISRQKLIKTGVFDDVIKDVCLPIIAPPDDESADNMLPIGVWSKLHKTSVIKENGLLFTSEKECISEDMFFDIEYLRRCKRAVILDEHGYNYRFNPKSISNAYEKERAERTFEFYKRLKVAVASDERFKPHAEHRVERCYIGACRSAFRVIESSGLTRKEKCAEIKRYLTNECTVEALKEFPIEKYRLFLRLVAWLMKRKWSGAVLFVFKIRRIMGLH